MNASNHLGYVLKEAVITPMAAICATVRMASSLQTALALVCDRVSTFITFSFEVLLRVE